jgi:4-hydroxy-3-polyprenylbenzoate decarboxylase
VGCGAGFPACQFAEGRLESLPHIPLSQQHCRSPPAVPSREILQAAAEGISIHLAGWRVPDLEVRNRVLLLSLKKDGAISGRNLAGNILAHPNLSAFSIFVLCDHAIDLDDGPLVLWKVFNNVDPQRDIVRKDNRIVIDATRKGPEDDHHRPWPDDIEMDPKVVETVKRRAAELGIESFV